LYDIIYDLFNHALPSRNNKMRNPLDRIDMMYRIF
jgi:hypothetical protein